MASIYFLGDSNSFAVRYIGFTSKTPQHRLNQQAKKGKQIAHLLKPEVIALAASRRRGRKLSAEHIQNISRAKKGIYPNLLFTNDVQERGAQTKRGQPLSEFHRSQISDAKKGKRQNHLCDPEVQARSQKTRHDNYLKKIAAADKLP